jgi:hypothetical protein
MIRFISIAFFAVLLLFTGPAIAADVQARADIEPQTCTIGDHLIYSITVTAPAEIKVFSPAAFDQGPFSLLKRLPEKVEEDSTVSRTIFRYRVAVYGVGQLTLPAQLIGYYRAGEQIENASTNKVTVNVLSMMPAAATTVEDLPPPDPVIAPQSIETANWMLLVALAIIILTALGVWLLFRYSRRLKPVTTAILGKKIDPRTPGQRVEDKLTEIELLKLLEQGKVKEHFSSTSEVMKAFFGEQNSFDSMEMTTRELIIALRSRNLPAQKLEGPQQMLSQCDMVKFAKYQPSVNEAKGLISWARRLVYEHKPSAPEPTIAILEKDKEDKTEK